MIEPLETEYAGCRFRSRLEARWAIFFDECGVEWEYEPEGFKVADSLCYLPDFLLHGVGGRAPSDLYVEVKGPMDEMDRAKIDAFCDRDEESGRPHNPLLVVGDIPTVNSKKYHYSILDSERDMTDGYLFDFATIDGDEFTAHLGVTYDGEFQLFGDDSNYLTEYDAEATENAYRKASQARFEHGETPVRAW